MKVEPTTQVSSTSTKNKFKKRKKSSSISSASSQNEEEEEEVDNKNDTSDDGMIEDDDDNNASEGEIEEDEEICDESTIKKSKTKKSAANNNSSHRHHRDKQENTNKKHKKVSKKHHRSSKNNGSTANDENNKNEEIEEKKINLKTNNNKSKTNKKTKQSSNASDNESVDEQSTGATESSLSTSNSSTPISSGISSSEEDEVEEKPKKFKSMNEDEECENGKSKLNSEVNKLKSKYKQVSKEIKQVKAKIKQIKRSGEHTDKIKKYLKRKLKLESKSIEYKSKLNAILAKKHHQSNKNKTKTKKNIEVEEEEEEGEEIDDEEECEENADDDIKQDNEDEEDLKQHHRRSKHRHSKKSENSKHSRHHHRKHKKHSKSIESNNDEINNVNSEMKQVPPPQPQLKIPYPVLNDKREMSVIVKILEDKRSNMSKVHEDAANSLSNPNLETNVREKLRVLQSTINLQLSRLDRQIEYVHMNIEINQLKAQKILNEKEKRRLEESIKEMNTTHSFMKDENKRFIRQHELNQHLEQQKQQQPQQIKQTEEQPIGKLDEQLKQQQKSLSKQSMYHLGNYSYYNNNYPDSQQSPNSNASNSPSMQSHFANLRTTSHQSEYLSNILPTPSVSSSSLPINYYRNVPPPVIPQSPMSATTPQQTQLQASKQYPTNSSTTISSRPSMYASKPTTPPPQSSLGKQHPGSGPIKSQSSTGQPSLAPHYTSPPQLSSNKPGYGTALEHKQVYSLDNRYNTSGAPPPGNFMPNRSLNKMSQPPGIRPQIPPSRMPINQKPSMQHHPLSPSSSPHNLHSPPPQPNMPGGQMPQFTPAQISQFSAMMSQFANNFSTSSSSQPGAFNSAFNQSQYGNQPPQNQLRRGPSFNDEPLLPNPPDLMPADFEMFFKALGTCFNNYQMPQNMNFNNMNPNAFMSMMTNMMNMNPNFMNMMSGIMPPQQQSSINNGAIKPQSRFNNNNSNINLQQNKRIKRN